MTDWFRNTTWNEGIEQAFSERLRRARRKEQYLRIQACTLVHSHPEIALKLLDHYFQLPDNFDHAQAHVDRATALVELGRMGEAIESYESALLREAEFPNLLTQAYLELPYLIASRGIREQYGRALELLTAHEARLAFPVDRFRWHAAQAMIAADSAAPDVAQVHARQALDAASRNHSGFRYHSSVGLVTKEYGGVIKRLETYAAA